MKVYLAGPMSGIPAHNYPAFHAAAARIRARGHDCVNPAEVNPDSELLVGDGITPEALWQTCIRRDIPHLLQCDALALLPNWKQSRGARLEVQIALALDMPILNEQTWLAEPVGKTLAIRELLEPVA